MQALGPIFKGELWLEYTFEFLELLDEPREPVVAGGTGVTIAGEEDDGGFHSITYFLALIMTS